MTVKILEAEKENYSKGNKPDLTRYAGTISDSDAAKLKEAVAANRAKFNKDFKQRAKRHCSYGTHKHD